jgi:putative hemolysin
LERPGLKLELSRACVHPEFRNGAVVILLWKGLTEYIRRTGASVLFGLSSVLSEDPSEIRLILDCLRIEDCIEERFNITARPDYKMSFDQCDLESTKVPELPPLLRMYLKAGARIAGDPAHDRDFKCVDLLTILEMDQMNPLVAKKYGFR